MKYPWVHEKLHHIWIQQVGAISKLSAEVVNLCKLHRCLSKFKDRLRQINRSLLLHYDRHKAPGKMFLQGLSQFEKIIKRALTDSFFASQIPTRAYRCEFHDEKQIFLDYPIWLSLQIFHQFVVFDFLELLFGVFEVFKADLEHTLLYVFWLLHLLDIVECMVLGIWLETRIITDHWVALDSLVVIHLRIVNFYEHRLVNCELVRLLVDLGEHVASLALN